MKDLCDTCNTEIDVYLMPDAQEKQLCGNCYVNQLLSWLPKSY